MKQQNIDWSKPRRQSPAALLILLVKALMSILRFAWPLLIVMVLRKKPETAGSDKYEIIALIISILSLLTSLVEYFNFRFSIRNNELVIRRGLFVKKTIHLPFEKIQAIHIEQNLLHSMLNVSRVAFDTAGSEKIEVKIEALDRGRSKALKEFITGQRATGIETGIQQPREEMIFTLSGRDLFKLSISANHLEAFFLLLTFIYTNLQTVGVSNQAYTGLTQQISEWLGVDGPRLIIILATLALVISIGFSVIRILLVYADFMISKEANGYRIRSGLINKKEKFLPFKRIQFISWKANWLRKQIGMYLLHFHATGKEQMEKKMKLNVPITRAGFIPTLLEHYHPLISKPAAGSITIARAFIWRRLLFFGFIPALIVLPFVFYYAGIQSLFVLIWPLIVFWYFWLFQRKFQCWPGKEAFYLRKGKFGVHDMVVKWKNIQSVDFEQGIYQRKHALASISLQTASGAIHIPYLRLEQANAIRDYALYKMETSSW